MKLLEENHYSKLNNLLNELPINILLFRAVIEKRVNGVIYVDNTIAPKTFYIVHPYGMSLLFGETENPEFNSKFINYALNVPIVREKYEWLQAYPDEWNNKLYSLFEKNLVKSNENRDQTGSNKIEEHTRVNFKFCKEKYYEFKKQRVNIRYRIIRTNKEFCESMPGSVVPKYFWNNSEHFCKEGIGFSLIYEGKLVSTAFSACIIEKQLELGIETVEGYKGMGFALYTCSALIDYCMENGYNPVWSCRYENTGSYKLAQKLGFEPTGYIPYYKLIY